MLKTIIFIFLGAVIFAILIREIIKWIGFLRTIRFRKKLKPGDYCRFRLHDKIETGYVINAWPEENLVRVRHLGVTHKLNYHDVFP